MHFFFLNQECVYIIKDFNSPGFAQSLEFLKSLENRDKVWENGKKSSLSYLILT